MIQLNEKSAFSSLIFLFGVVLIIQTFGMRSDVALVPRIIGVPLLLFAGFQMIVDLFPAVRKKFPFLDKKKKTIFDSEEDEAEGSAKQRYLFFSWMVFIVVLIYLFNVIWAIALSLFVYLKWISKESWKLSILYSAGFAVVIYLIFVVGLGIYYFF